MPCGLVALSEDKGSFDFATDSKGESVCCAQEDRGWGAEARFL
jgi:hypothetical protein